MNISYDLNFTNREKFINYVTFHKQTLVDKNELILSLCKNKKVLDVGCIDHSYKNALDQGDKWLHKQIKQTAKEVTGLDILLEDTIELNKHGFNIKSGNAENFHLGETFDVIVAGDLIEHLSNMGLFLKCVNEHMANDSVFVFTTPNPFSIEQSMLALFTNMIIVNPEHTCWLSPHVCWELIAREGLEIKGFYWIDTRFNFPVRKIFGETVINLFSRFVLNKRNLCKRDFAIIIQKKHD
jgi:predicted TPR repeat methyltransferase